MKIFKEFVESVPIIFCLLDKTTLRLGHAGIVDHSVIPYRCKLKEGNERRKVWTERIKKNKTKKTLVNQRAEAEREGRRKGF